MTKCGTALHVTPSIEREFHSAVIAQLPDLTDGEMQRYNRNKRELGHLLRTAFAGNAKATKIFPILCKGSYTTSELVAQGRYAWSNDLITDERFPLEKHAPVSKTIELMSFDYEPTSDEVITTLKCRGLELPSYEDAFYFGIKYPNEQKKRPIIFLPYEVMFNLHGARVVIFLSKDGCGRCLTLDWYTGTWNKNCVFAAVRKLS